MTVLEPAAFAPHKQHELIVGTHLRKLFGHYYTRVDKVAGYGINKLLIYILTDKCYWHNKLKPFAALFDYIVNIRVLQRSHLVAFHEKVFCLCGYILGIYSFEQF